MSIPMLRVAASSPPATVAGAIAKILRANDQVQVQAIGPGAVNQMIKATAVADSYLRADGLALYCRPAFVSADEPQDHHHTNAMALRLTIFTSPRDEDSPAFLPPS